MVLRDREKMISEAWKSLNEKKDDENDIMMGIMFLTFIFAVCLYLVAK